MTGDNGVPVTPDWTPPAPKPSPFAADMSRDERELPERFELGEN